MLSSCIPAFIVIVEDSEGISNSVQGKIEGLSSSSETHFIIAQSKIFDLLGYCQLFNWYNLCASSTCNGSKFDIGVTWFLEIKIKKKFTVWQIF